MVGKYDQKWYKNKKNCGQENFMEENSCQQVVTSVWFIHTNILLHSVGMFITWIGYQQFQINPFIYWELRCLLPCISTWRISPRPNHFTELKNQPWLMSVVGRRAARGIQLHCLYQRRPSHTDTCIRNPENEKYIALSIFAYYPRTAHASQTRNSLKLSGSSSLFSEEFSSCPSRLPLQMYPIVF